MSDLQDLIHRNAKLAFDQGVITERQRILDLLSNLRRAGQKSKLSGTANINAVIALIKADPK